MRKAQRFLTISGLAVFALIIGFHYLSEWELCHLTAVDWFGTRWYRPIIPDIHMPLFVLGVFYAGCMALAKAKAT